MRARESLIARLSLSLSPILPLARPSFHPLGFGCNPPPPRFVSSLAFFLPSLSRAAFLLPRPFLLPASFSFPRFLFLIFLSSPAGSLRLAGLPLWWPTSYTGRSYRAAMTRKWNVLSRAVIHLFFHLAAAAERSPSPRPAGILEEVSSVLTRYIRGIFALAASRVRDDELRPPSSTGAVPSGTARAIRRSGRPYRARLIRTIGRSRGRRN